MVAAPAAGVKQNIHLLATIDRVIRKSHQLVRRISGIGGGQTQWLTTFDPSSGADMHARD